MNSLNQKRTRFERAERALEQAEIRWQKEWDAILCPFEKVKVYCSDAKRAERKKIIDEYLVAKEKYSAVRSRIQS